MARNSFTTGFGAGLGVLLAIFLFPLLLFGGCLVMVGSCGVAAVKSLPSTQTTSKRTTEPTSANPTTNNQQGSQFNPEIIGHVQSRTIRSGGIHRYTVYTNKPTKSDIALHAMTLHQSCGDVSHIEISYYDDKQAAVAARVKRGGFGDNYDGLIPEWTFPHNIAHYLYNAPNNHTQLLFNRSLKNEGGNISGKALALLNSSEIMADAEPSFDVYQAFYGAAFRLADIIIDYSGYLANVVAPTTPQTKYMTIYGRKMTANEIWEEDQHKSLQRKKQEQDFAYYIDMLKKSNEQAAENAKYRTWTSANGKFTKEARISSVANGNITLIARDGQKIVVSIDKLSDQDQQFITQWRRKH